MMRISEVRVLLKQEKLKAMPFQNIEVEDGAFDEIINAFSCLHLNHNNGV